MKLRLPMEGLRVVNEFESGNTDWLGCKFLITLRLPIRSSSICYSTKITVGSESSTA